MTFLIVVLPIRLISLSIVCERFFLIKRGIRIY